VVDFINEVEEELRKDDYNRLLKKYGPAIGVILFLIVAGAGYMEYRKYADAKEARAVAAIYTAADTQQDEGQKDDAIVSFAELGGTGPDGYSGLSYMRAAAISLDQGDVQGAIQYFDQAAARFTRPRHKDLAQLKAAYLLADQGSHSELIARLPPLTEKDAPYEYLAYELLGFAYAESGDISNARQQYAFLTSVPGVPTAIKARAEQSMALLSTKSSLEAPAPIAPAVPDTIPETPTEPDSVTQEDATNED